MSKSASLTVPFVKTRKFEGLMSLWMMLSEWRKSMAESMSRSFAVIATSIEVEAGPSWLVRDGECLKLAGFSSPPGASSWTM